MKGLNESAGSAAAFGEGMVDGILGWPYLGAKAFGNGINYLENHDNPNKLREVSGRINPIMDDFGDNASEKVLRALGLDSSAEWLRNAVDKNPNINTAGQWFNPVRKGVMAGANAVKNTKNINEAIEGTADTAWRFFDPKTGIKQTAITPKQKTKFVGKQVQGFASPALREAVMNESGNEIDNQVAQQ